MKYLEYEVPATLQRHVQCIWRLTADPSQYAQAIYPDGRCELIVHLATPMRRLLLSGEWEQQTPCLFAGQQTEAIRLQAQSPVDCVGIRLQPAAAVSVIKRSAHIFQDLVVDLAQFQQELALDLTHATRHFSTTADMTKLSDVLLLHLKASALDQRIESAVSLIDQSLGSCAIAPLASQAGMSQRSFQYQFLQVVGLQAKTYARIIRLQATLKRLDQIEPSMVEVCDALGFSDQAHANRELKRITGLTPLRLRAALRDQRDDTNTIQLAAAFVRGRSASSPTCAQSVDDGFGLMRA